MTNEPTATNEPTPTTTTIASSFPGWTLHDTGGGCAALLREFRGGCRALLTTPDDPQEPTDPRAPMVLGLLHADDLENVFACGFRCRDLAHVEAILDALAWIGEVTVTRAAVQS